MAELEWALLASALAPAAALETARAASGDAAELAARLLEEQPAAVLAHPRAAGLLGSGAPSTGDAGRDGEAWCDAVAAGVAAAEEPERLHALFVAAAALHAFLQANLTGPASDLAEDPRHVGVEPADAKGSAQEPELGRDSTSAGDRWALRQLAADGEDVAGKCQLPRYLLLAQTILLMPLGMRQLGQGGAGERGLQAALGPGWPHTWLWWAARLLAVRQRLLTGLSYSLREALSALLPQVLQLVSDAPASVGELGPELAALAQLEAALVEHVYSHPAGAATHLQAAQDALGFSAELTGALGLRTVHQADAKAQLIVRCSSSARGCGEAGEPAAALDATSDQGSAAADAPAEAVSDVLQSLKLVGEEAEGAASRTELRPLEQAALLALGEQRKRAQAGDELRGWEVAAFADAVLAQPRSRFLLRAAARLSRVRFERGRSRTRDRALLEMEQLAEALAAPAALGSRACFAHAVLLPLRCDLQRELGEQRVAAGLVGAAMEVFERLELWDSLLLCYRLLEKVPQALALVRTRLQVVPDDARLLCALGDLTREPQHYSEAWERSGWRNARAQRSLATWHMSQSNFQQAAEHWELALAINPLHPAGWFALGFCCLKCGNSTRAVQALTRCTQQQPDNGEAWNNIAAVMLQEGRYKEAFSALSEAVKFKRDSWQTWSNLAGAAVKVESWQAAARAVHQVGELSRWQRLELEVLQALVGAVEQARRRDGGYGQPDAAPARTGDQILERSVQSALKAAANAPATPPAAWGLIAQLNRALGFPDSARDALRKQVRGLAGAGWQADAARFREYAAAVVASAEFSLAAAAGGDAAAGRDLAAARMLLQGVAKSTGGELRGEELYGEAQRLLAAVQAAEADARAAGT